MSSALKLTGQVSVDLIEATVQRMTIPTVQGFTVSLVIAGQRRTSRQ